MLRLLDGLEGSDPGLERHQANQRITLAHRMRYRTLARTGLLSAGVEAAYTGCLAEGGLPIGWSPRPMTGGDGP